MKLIRPGLHKLYRIILIGVLFIAIAISSSASPIYFQDDDSAWHSTKEDALLYLNSFKKLDASQHWPNVTPDLFLENLKTFVVSPLKFFQGRSTNFCAYSALTYIPFHYNPLIFCKFMISLYKNGKAKMGKVNFRPSEEVRMEAGLIKYKGDLDINPMGQMWFLTLADHFKGYLNFFNRHFDKGDENTLWAVSNFSKFKRMLRKLFPLRVHARGSDLCRPWIKNLYGFLHERLNSGTVFLLVNYLKLYSVDHVKFRLDIPNHYVHLLGIERTESGMINLYYSDEGTKTLQQITPALLKKIVFGVAWCNVKQK